MILRARQHLFEFPRRPLVLGSVCVSGHEGAALPGEAVTEALAEARRLVRQGAEIIVVGMDSPAREYGGARAHEAEALTGFVRLWREAAQTEPLAIQTSCPKVAQAALAAGGDLLVDSRPSRARAEASYAGLCAQYGAALVIEHVVGRDTGSGLLAQGADVLAETQQFFEEALCSAQADGLSREAVVLGLRLHNEEPVFAAASLHLVAQMGCFHRWERPLLLTDVPAATRAPAATLNADATERQTAAMVARMVHGMLEGVQIFHGGNVEAVAATVRTISAVLS